MVTTIKYSFFIFMIIFILVFTLMLPSLPIMFVSWCWLDRIHHHHHHHYYYYYFYYYYYYYYYYSLLHGYYLVSYLDIIWSKTLESNPAGRLPNINSSVSFPSNVLSIKNWSKSILYSRLIPWSSLNNFLVSKSVKDKDLFFCATVWVSVNYEYVYMFESRYKYGDW